MKRLKRASEQSTETQPGRPKLGVKGCLFVAVALAVLAALGIYSALPHPTHDETRLRAIAAESRQLILTYPVTPNARSVHLPRNAWPPVIASLKPESVAVRHGMVDITIKPFFDGGWGYGFAHDKQNLTMLVECWSALGHDVYWHGPC
jgi:hypothetical protein